MDNPCKEAQSKSYFTINGTKVFHILNELETTIEKCVSRQRKWDRNEAACMFKKV